MAWNTQNKPFDFYSSDFDTETAEVKCDGCSEVFDWSDKERGSGDEIPICSQVCYEKFYSEESSDEEESEPYCFKDSTIDTIENDICFCSVGGCVKPTEFDPPQEEPIICEDCERDFTEECDDRSSFEEIGKVQCMDCFDKEEEVCSDMGICDACEDALPDELLVGVGDHEQLGKDYNTLCEGCYLAEGEGGVKEEEVCSDCGRTEEELDANDVELTGEGKYARCLDCEDERFSHMEDACEECGDRVGRHAANVGTIGMAICFDCDAHGAYAEATEEHKTAMEDTLNYIKWDLTECDE